jgi:hypothetical protein
MVFYQDKGRGCFVAFLTIGKDEGRGCFVAFLTIEMKKSRAILTLLYQKYEIAEMKF